MPLAAHRIRRQRWQVKAPSAAAAFAIRSQLRATLDTLMLPAFERAFDKLGVGDEVVRIPRLTLNLKIRAGEDFGNALAQALRAELDEVLHEMVIAHPSQSDVIRQTAAGNARQILLSYLAEGRLDWPAGVSDPAQAASELREQARCLCETPQSAMQLIAGTLTQREAIGFRLLQLLPDDLRLTLLKSAPHFTTAMLHEILPAQAHAAGFMANNLATLLPTVLRQLAVPGMLGSYLQLRVQALWLALRDEEIRFPLAPVILALLRECRASLERNEQTASLRAILGMLTQPQPISAAGIAQSLPRGAGAATSMPIASAPDAAIHAEAARPTATTSEQANKIPAIAPSAADAAAQSGFLAGDAGLMLLHPFLARLFETLGIAPAGCRELPEAMLPRAAALLHWLVSGREEIFEFELVAIKVLLGCAPDQMLPVAAGLLSDEERNEADRLLAATIQHWEALGKTSIAALRMSFLQRRGVLRGIDQGWQLQVEPESFDMLLGKLPWGIAIVKLPWMTRPIFTEWPTH
jgi:hypothetical protein